jgi:hypothetical protein
MDEDTLAYLLVGFTAVSFLCYALSALLAKRMAVEFERYGYADKRVLVAVSQLLGVLGLAVGILVPAIGILASAGLAAQMVCALVVRYRIRDPLLHFVPAAAYLAISIALTATFAARIFS